MRLRALAIVPFILLSSAAIAADDHVVLFDQDVNFAAFKTFRIGSGRVKSDRPELNFPSLLSGTTDAVRKGLRIRRLAEVSDTPDLMVDFTITGVDYNIGPFGRPNIVIGGRGTRGRPSAPAGPIDFTEATLVIDLTEASSNTLVWRGVYHDTEEDAAKLVESLPKDAGVLVAAYPPRKR